MAADRVFRIPRWCRRVAGRLVVLLPLKAVGTMGFLAIFFAAYFAVLHHPRSTPVLMPLTTFDAWVPFTPAAFPVYASLWAYVSLPPAFCRSFRALALYGAWVAAMCLFCMAIFWLYPTAVPLPDIDWAAHPELEVLRGLDAAGNAFPSLHVASAVFSAVWLDRFLSRVGAPVLLRLASAAHCAAIVWSTLAIRQHVLLDVVAGLAVGAVFALLSYRRVRAAVGSARL